MLQFCQECEVYHNITYLNGEPVLNECQRKINDINTTDVNQQSGNIVYFNKNDFSPKSPKSNVSFYSSSPKNHIQSLPSPPSIFRTQSQNTFQKIPEKSFRKYQHMNIQAISKKAVPVIKISYLSKQKPLNSSPSMLYPVQNMSNIQLSAMPQKSGAFFKLHPNNLLSTIKEESGRETSPSKSRKSLQSIDNQSLPVELKGSVYQFRQLQRASFENHPFIQEKIQANTNDGNCCCW